MTPEEAKQRGIKIKPLRWGLTDTPNRDLQADCPFGRYYIAGAGEYGWKWWRPASGPPPMGLEPTAQAAKAAAQADFERRILEVLE